MERRRFVVIGLGKFGYHLARALYELGHDVLALDHNPTAVDAARSYCSRATTADATDKEALEAAGVGNADVAVVGLGTHMEASILATLFLQELGVKEVVAKATSSYHGRILKRIGAAEVIHPERDMAVQLAQRLAEPDVLEKLPFMEGYVLVELRAPRGLHGKTLSEARLRDDHRLSIALIKRPKEGRELSVPATGDERILQGDVLVVLAKMEDVEAFREAHPDLGRSAT